MTLHGAVDAVIAGHPVAGVWGGTSAKERAEIRAGRRQQGEEAA